MHRTSVVLALLVVGCTPNNAKMENGKYITFLSDGTSQTLLKEAIDVEQYTDPPTYNVDCREFEDAQERNALQLDEPIKICGENVWPPEYEEWATQAGFRVVSEPMDPWRGEAFLTVEGDLQVSFHHRPPSGGDTRIVFTIDPNFAPTTCPPGAVAPEPLDGDWLENWSTELDYVDSLLGMGDENPMPGAFDHLEGHTDGKVWFLNAFSYQYNPANTDGFDWDILQEWSAGAASGKFVEELVAHRTSRYGNPQAYNAVEVAGGTETGYGNVDPADLWQCDLDLGEDPTQNACMISLEEEVRGVQQATFEEISRLSQPDKDADPIFAYAPLTHVNFWRPPDGLDAGLDGWGELHYSYVVFDASSNFEVGGQASGAFSLVLDAQSSSTRMYVTAEFVIDRIKKDTWTTDDLMREKLKENDTFLCSAASAEDGQPLP